MSKMIDIVLDIETIPNQTIKHDDIVNRKLDNLKEKNIDTNYNKFCSINPAFGQIVNIVIGLGNDNISFLGKNETDLLTEFWECMGEFNSNEIKLVSFNGKRFDVPYILLRSSILKVAPTVKLAYRRYDTYKHFDCIEILTNFYQDQNFLTLKEYAEIYGITNNDKDNGSDVYKLFKEDNLDDINKHCIEDINTTRKLYNILNYYI